MSNKSFKNTWLHTTNKISSNQNNVITSNGASFTFKPENNASTYLEWRKSDGNRFAYLGRAVSGSKSITLSVSEGNIELFTDNSKDVIISARKLVSNNFDGVLECKHLRMGYGSNNAWITPENNSTKTLFFGKANAGRFNLNLENASKIINVPNPTNNHEVANKAYVDSKAPSFQELVSWTGNFATTNLTFSKNQSFPTTGLYEFVVQMKINTRVYSKNIIMNLDDFTKDNLSEVFYFVDNVVSDRVANLNTLTSAYALLIARDKIVKIIRYGTIPNATNSSLKIHYRKL